MLSYASMGFFMDDASSSGLILSHVLYKAAFVIALMRWALFWALKLRRTLLSSSSSASASDRGGYDLLQADHDDVSCSSFSSSSLSIQLIRDCLVQTTYEDITRRRGSYGCCDTCAVCLSKLEMEDEVREMRNCCHVFHTECIDRWLEYQDGHHYQHHHDDHDGNHKTCPLCRTPLLTSSQIQNLSWEQRAQPSWAVERLLYLFGDDLAL